MFCCMHLILVLLKASQTHTHISHPSFLGFKVRNGVNDYSELWETALFVFYFHPRVCHFICPACPCGLLVSTSTLSIVAFLYWNSYVTLRSHRKNRGPLSWDHFYLCVKWRILTRCFLRSLLTWKMIWFFFYFFLFTLLQTSLLPPWLPPPKPCPCPLRPPPHRHLCPQVVYTCPFCLHSLFFKYCCNTDNRSAGHIVSSVKFQLAHTPFRAVRAWLTYDGIIFQA